MPDDLDVAGSAASATAEPAGSDAGVLLTHSGAVQRYCRAQLASETDAEDAVQETFVRYLQRSDRNVRNPEAWLIAVAKRACQDTIRRRQRQRLEDFDPESVMATSPAPDDAVLAASLVSELLKSLRDKDAQLLFRLYVGGWSFEQVARDLKLTEGNVRVMALRARRRAAKILEEMGVGQSALGLGTLLPGVRGWVGDRRAGLRERVRWAFWRRPARFPDNLLAAGATAGNLAVAAVVLALLAGSGAPQGRPTANAAARAGNASVPPNSAGSAALPAAPAPGSAALGTRSRNGGRPGGPAGFVGETLNHVQNPQTQDAAFTSIVASPSYRTDHTIYASGTQVRGCPGSCPLLFRSTDSGATWVLWSNAAAGFAGGDVLLPTGFPKDPTIFAIGPGGLQRSSDAGRTFALIVPGTTQGSAQPGTAPGEAVIALATNPLLIYSESTGLVSAGPRLPLRVAAVDRVAYLFDGTRIAIAGEQVDPAAPRQVDAVLGICDTSQCVSTFAVPGALVTELAVSPTEAVDHTLGAVLGSKLWLSSDDARTFAAPPIDANTSVLSLAFDPGYLRSRRLTVAGVSTSRQSTSLLLNSADGGRTLARVATSGLPAGSISSVALLPDGRWLVGQQNLDKPEESGIRCSTDGGHNWTAACTGT